MLRTLQRSKRPLSACLQNAISTSAVGQSSGSPAVAQSSSGGGFLSNLFGGGHARLQVPLTDPLPGVENPYLQNAPKEVPPTELSTLSNGIKVASEDTLVSAMPIIFSDVHHMQELALMGTCNQHNGTSLVVQTAALYELRLQHAGSGCLLQIESNLLLDIPSPDDALLPAAQ